MNTTTARTRARWRNLLLWVCVVCLDCSCSTTAPTGGGGSATVTFNSPIKFSDVQLSGLSREESLAAVLPQLEAAFVASAHRHLAAGQALQLEIKNIRMPGILTQRGTGQIRILTTRYPAVIELSYSLTSGSGTPPESGTARLVRLPSEMDSLARQRDEHHLIKRMMDDWIHGLAAGGGR